MIAPAQVPALLRLLADEHEHASDGTRRALAGLLDDLGLELKRQGLAAAASYAFGRADGLRRVSRSRRERAPIFN